MHRENIQPLLQLGIVGLRELHLPRINRFVLKIMIHLFLVTLHCKSVHKIMSYMSLMYFRYLTLVSIIKAVAAISARASIGIGYRYSIVPTMNSMWSTSYSFEFTTISRINRIYCINAPCFCRQQLCCFHVSMSLCEAGF